MRIGGALWYERALTEWRVRSNTALSAAEALAEWSVRLTQNGKEREQRFISARTHRQKKAPCQSRNLFGSDSSRAFPFPAS